MSAYELERVSGLSVGNEEFQEAVRRAVPNGHSFKGFPIQFVHKNARKAFVFSLKYELDRNLILSRSHLMFRVILEMRYAKKLFVVTAIKFV